MTDVVEQGSIPEGYEIIVLNLQLSCHEGGDVQNTKGVLKAGMARSRVDQMRIGKLFDPPQPLKRGGI